MSPAFSDEGGEGTGTTSSGGKMEIIKSKSMDIKNIITASRSNLRGIKMRTLTLK